MLNLFRNQDGSSSIIGIMILSALAERFLESSDLSVSEMLEYLENKCQSEQSGALSLAVKVCVDQDLRWKEDGFVAHGPFQIADNQLDLPIQC